MSESREELSKLIDHALNSLDLVFQNTPDTVLSRNFYSIESITKALNATKYFLSDYKQRDLLEAEDIIKRAIRVWEHDDLSDTIVGDILYTLNGLVSGGSCPLCHVLEDDWDDYYVKIYDKEDVKPTYDELHKLADELRNSMEILLVTKSLRSTLETIIVLVDDRKYDQLLPWVNKGIAELEYQAAKRELVVDFLNTTKNILS